MRHIKVSVLLVLLPFLCRAGMLLNPASKPTAASPKDSAGEMRGKGDLPWEANFPYAVDQTEDAFNKTKSLSLQMPEIEDAYKLSSVQLELSKVRSKGSTDLYLNANYKGKDWLFIQKGDSMSFLIDGSKVVNFSTPFGSDEHRDVTDNGVEESAIYFAPKSKLKLVASAKTLKIRVHGRGSYWDADVQEGVRANFVRFYKEQVAPK